MTYTTRSGDQAWRKILITKNSVPGYTPVESVGQQIDYSEDAVLEILCADGQEILVYDRPERRNVACTRKINGEYQLNVEARYAARMWIRDDSGMEYKIPGDLKPFSASTGPVRNTCVFRISNVSGEVRLIGDRYAARVFDLDTD